MIVLVVSIPGSKDTVVHTGHWTSHHFNTDSCMLIFTPTVYLESPVNMTRMYLECGKKLEYPEGTHTGTGRRCKLTQKHLIHGNEQPG